MTPIPPKPGILEISPYVGGKSKLAAARVVKLSSNENPLGASPKAVEAYRQHGSKLHRYPEGAASELRAAIGLAEGLDANRIVCGAGSDELIGLLIHAYAGAGDEVLYSQYGFLMYKIYAQSNGATPVAAPERHFIADVDALLEKVTERTRILFLANPNNPTGSYLPASEVARLRAHLPERVILAIDGAYAEYADALDYSDGRELVERSENTVMLRTFSKIHGLSSLRLGWGYYPASIADVMHRVRGPFNVSGASIQAGIAAISDRAHQTASKAHNLAWRERLTRECQRMGWRPHPTLGNFIMLEFPESPGKGAADANRFLLERGLILRELHGYGLPHCLRVTIGTEEENQLLLTALEDFARA
jgi:histidinol-phosphate aminotransferase